VVHFAVGFNTPPLAAGRFIIVVQKLQFLQAAQAIVGVAKQDTAPRRGGVAGARKRVAPKSAVFAPLKRRENAPKMKKRVAHILLKSCQTLNLPETGIALKTNTPLYQTLNFQYNSKSLGGFMTISEMFAQSGALTMLGMGVVFGFLIILTIVITVAGRVIHALRLDNDVQADNVSQKTAVAGGIDGAVVAAITAAVNTRRRA
jgi:oxaloacetate decarboxylase gamma subunit